MRPLIVLAKIARSGFHFAPLGLGCDRQFQLRAHAITIALLPIVRTSSALPLTLSLRRRSADWPLFATGDQVAIVVDVARCQGATDLLDSSNLRHCGSSARRPRETFREEIPLRVGCSGAILRALSMMWPLATARSSCVSLSKSKKTTPNPTKGQCHRCHCPVSRCEQPMAKTPIKAVHFRIEVRDNQIDLPVAVVVAGVDTHTARAVAGHRDAAA